MPNGCYIDLGGKKTGKQNKDSRYIKSLCFGRVLACPTELPQWAIRRIKKPGTDCMKSFELHKMLTVTFSQASSWQLLRVSNNNSKISIYSLSLCSDPVCNTVPQVMHTIVFALFLLLTFNCAYNQVHSNLVKHSEHRKTDIQPLNSVVFGGDPVQVNMCPVMQGSSVTH